MKILAIDTSSKLCSVAILENEKPIAKIERNEGLTHSEILMPSIEQILRENNSKLSDIELLACDIGPGSFTGIRIGIATLKAFSDSLGIPALGVDSLACYAYDAIHDGKICSIIDCKNENCYFALYEVNSNKLSVLEGPQTNSIQNCLSLLKNNYSNQSITFTGDGCMVYHDIIQNNIPNSTFIDVSSNQLDVYHLGIIAYHKFIEIQNEKSNILPPLLPLYLKKPQAQRQLESKKLIIEPMQIEDLNGIDITKFDDFWSLENLKNEFSSKVSEWFIAKIDQKVIGFAGIKKVLDEADIMNLAIHKDYRTQGFAYTLLNYLITIAKEKNITKLQLEVNEKNIPAINLYKKLKFVIVGRRKKYYGEHDAILMNLYLNS